MLGPGSAPIVNPTAQYAVQYFIDQGLTREQAVGVVGNLQQESYRDLQTTVRGDGGKAIGIAQWWPDRAQNLRGFAETAGKDWRDLDTQLAFVLHEMGIKSDHPNAPGYAAEARAARALQAARTPEEAARAMAGYERARGFAWNNPTGIHGWNNRYANTMALYGKPVTGRVERPAQPVRAPERSRGVGPAARGAPQPAPAERNQLGQPTGGARMPAGLAALNLSDVKVTRPDRDPAGFGYVRGLSPATPGRGLQLPGFLAHTPAGAIISGLGAGRPGGVPTTAYQTSSGVWSWPTNNPNDAKFTPNPGGGPLSWMGRPGAPAAWPAVPAPVGNASVVEAKTVAPPVQVNPITALAGWNPGRIDDGGRGGIYGPAAHGRGSLPGSAYDRLGYGPGAPALAVTPAGRSSGPGLGAWIGPVVSGLGHAASAINTAGNAIGNAFSFADAAIPPSIGDSRGGAGLDNPMLGFADGGEVPRPRPRPLRKGLTIESEPEDVVWSEHAGSYVPVVTADPEGGFKPDAPIFHRGMRGVLPPIEELGAATTKQPGLQLDQAFSDGVQDLKEIEVPLDSHILRRGDTLWELAKKYYGNALFWEAIAAANGITDPTKLAVGRELIIPSIEELGADTSVHGGALEGVMGHPATRVAPRPNPLRMAAGGNAGRGRPGGNAQAGLLDDAVAGRTDRLPIHVQADSYVVPADIVSAMGQGNTRSGGAVLDKIFSGFSAGDAPVKPRRTVPIVAAGGEYVVPAHVVAALGGGSEDAGHKALDTMVANVRKHHVKALQKLPPPKRS